jgi:hypothetical protein
MGFNLGLKWLNTNKSQLKEDDIASLMHVVSKRIES